MADAVLIYATAPDAVVAERIARILVEERLVACANLLPGMRSVYRWRGAVETAEECVLVCKTSAGLADAAMARLGGLHPYELPAVVAVPVAAAPPAVLAWIAEATGR
jgi:periplasmic divalent cation tolerance protein